MPEFQFRDTPMSDTAMLMPALNDLLHSDAQSASPEEAAVWLIEQLDDESMQLTGQHLFDFDLWFFSHSPLELGEARRNDGIGAVSRGVSLVRSRVDRLNAIGSPSGQVARGLWVPWEIEYRYETIYQSEFPWGISFVMQGAFLGNPLAGDRGPWKNKRPKFPTAG
ncbi:hypothetical protein [Microcella alkalica]|uniref:Uncharacterized protein n=1 Tax=Microcella alkalica TaxID=355930 RepID=A0A839EB08_9MICO|nr:hypothetical protein [Microcella alkalica]MBA8848353.1 hypothetical protein [Microcella alkalica]